MERGIVEVGSTILLASPYELKLAKHILRFGEVLELVSRELKPHHSATYLYKLAVLYKRVL